MPNKSLIIYVCTHSFFVKPIFAILFFLLLSAQTCQKSQTGMTPVIFKHWVHSFEEDTQGMQAYRPASYAFPLSRGREGFEVKEDGTFVLHNIGPADGTDKIPGTWKQASGSTLKVTFSQTDIAPYTIQIIQASDTLLTLKKIQ
jgi:hypothetical protein